MKKLFLLAILFAIASIGSAQVTPMTSIYNHPTDTVTNAGINFVYATSLNSQSNLSVQPVITKISGTIAGTYYLQGSLDGVNYLSIVGDSTVATNVTTNTKVWFLATKYFKYYRIGYTGTGTMSGTLRGYILNNNILR